MRSRNVLFTLVLLLGIFVFAIFKKRQEPLRKEAFHRMPDKLLFYAFARCRMRCLGLNETDIKTVMQKGVININRSRRTLQPCPLFAVQERVHNRYLRVVFEQCRNSTYVVTCYDLTQNPTCNCSTDYTPNQP